MQLVSYRIRTISMCVSALIITASFVEAAVAKPMLVEVWSGGDDGLTMRFTDAIKLAFETSREFKLSSGMKPGTLVVTIPSHVGWNQIGKRTQVLYNVEFSTVGNQSIGMNTGSCFEDMFSECTTKILERAQIAAKQIK